MTKATIYMRAITVSLTITLAIFSYAQPPAGGPPEDYVAHLDLAYADRDEERNLLDIFVPSQAENPPIVVYIHGGAFRFGSKENPNDLDLFMKAGIAVASINYRFSGDAIWPAQLEDIKDAFSFIRENGDNYGYDATRVASYGGSAGAHLAAVAGIVLAEGENTALRATVALFPPVLFHKMDEDMATVGMEPRLGPTDAGNSPESLLIGAPVGENPDLAEAASPISYLNDLPADTPLPAFLIMHGSEDTNIARGQSGRLFSALLNRPTMESMEYHLLPNSGHGNGEFDSLETSLLILEFLRKHLGE